MSTCTSLEVLIYINFGLCKKCMSMATYRNSDEALMERVRRYIKGLGYYAKPPGGIPASDLAGWVLPSAVTDKSVGDLGYTKNEGTVTGAKVNNVLIEDEDGVVDIGTVVTDVSGKQDVIDASHKLNADLVDDASATHKFVTASDKTTWNGKQDALVSGTNIKTINNESILGSGDITIQGGDVSGKEDKSNKVTSLSSSSTDTEYPSAKCVYDLVGDIETLLAAI